MSSNWVNKLSKVCNSIATLTPLFTPQFPTYSANQVSVVSWPAATKVRTMSQVIVTLSHNLTLTRITFTIYNIEKWVQSSATMKLGLRQSMSSWLSRFLTLGLPKSSWKRRWRSQKWWSGTREGKSNHMLTPVPLLASTLTGNRNLRKNMLNSLIKPKREKAPKKRQLEKNFKKRWKISA